MTNIFIENDMLLTQQIIQNLDTSYLPVAIECTDNEINVCWLDMKGADLTSPFLSDTISKVRCRNGRTVIKSDVSLLYQCAKDLSNRCQLSGLLFHTSRCGSTLASQLISHTPSCICLSEPQFADQIIRTLKGVVPPKEQISLLRAFIQMWLHYLSPGFSRCFIKLDCWLIHDFDFIADCFPQTQYYFLYRDLSQVIASQLKIRGAFLIPQLVPSAYFGLPEPGARFVEPSEYMLDVLAGIYQCGWHLSKHNKLKKLSYSNMPGNILKDILGQPATSEHHYVLTYHAKDKCRVFEGDRDKDKTLLPEVLKQVQARQHEIETQYSAD